MAKTKKVAKAAPRRFAPPSGGLRSGFEKAGKDFLNANKIPFKYESVQYPYVVPAITRRYYPDFQIGEWNVEFKGRWIHTDRMKHLLLKKAHPGMKLLFVFQAPNNKISKKSHTTYGEWADKNGMLWMTFPEFQHFMLELKKEGKV